MSFKPKNKNNNSKGGSKRDPNFKYPTPKSGARPARISLIVHLGTQERDDFEDPKTGEKRALDPIDQLALFADLTNDVVDYGGEIGKNPYRLMLNSSFKGKVSGTTFGAVPPQSEDGLWTFHPNSLLTKLARATDTEEIVKEEEHNMDVELLLGKPFMAEVVVEDRESKTATDDDGNPIVFTNVRFRGSSSVPDIDGFEVPELEIEPMIITMDNVTKETVKFIRADVLRTMQKSVDYKGSALDKLKGKPEGGYVVPKETEEEAKSAEPPVEAATVDSSYFDDDVPF